MNKEELKFACNEFNGQELKLWLVLSFVGEVNYKEAEEYGINRSAYYKGISRVKPYVRGKEDMRKKANGIRKLVVEALMGIPDEKLGG